MGTYVNAGLKIRFFKYLPFVERTVANADYNFVGGRKKMKHYSKRVCINAGPHFFPRK
jgi:hypothetical protein